VDKNLAGTDTEIEGCEASVGQIKEVKPAVVTDEDVVRVGGVDRKAAGNFTLNNSISS